MTRSKIDQDSADELTKYGIARMPVDYFHYQGFRYSSLEDAIAEAKRRQTRAPDGKKS